MRASSLLNLYSVQPFPESDDAAEELRVFEALVVEKPGPSQRQDTLINSHGTKIFHGLPTPGNTPVKASGNQVRFHIITSLIPPDPHPCAPQLASAVHEEDIEMDDTFTRGSSPTPTLGPDLDLPALQESEPQPGVVATLENRIMILAQEKAALLEKEQYVLRKLSRNGQGTLSDIEAVADRAVRERDKLRVEKKELRVVVERLLSGIAYLQEKIASTQDKLERAEGERVEMAQSKRRWIARMWTLAGRIPGELRKKDAEIQNMREKLVGMHALLAQEQSKLEEVQGQFAEEKKRRMDVQVEFENSKIVHAQETKERDLAGQRLRTQLMNVVNGLGSGAISI